MIALDSGSGALQAFTGTTWREGAWSPTTSNSPIPTVDDGTGGLGLSLFNSRGASLVITLDTSGFTGLRVEGDFSRNGNPSLNRWGLAYSVDGGISFTGVGTASAWNFGWNHLVWDLSGISALDDQASVVLRLNSRMPNTVADWWTSGAVDNLLITATSTNPVPEPASIALVGTAASVLVLRRRRARRRVSSGQSDR